MLKPYNPIQAEMHRNGVIWRLLRIICHDTRRDPGKGHGRYPDGGFVSPATPTDPAYIIVPFGFVHDFATIPRWLRWYVGPTGKHARAAVIHDWLYLHKVGSRAWADRIFREVLKRDGVGSTKRSILWAAVRLGGAGAWKSRAAYDWQTGKLVGK